MAIGEIDFIESLVRELPAANRIAAWILGDAMAAEDAIQESAAKAWDARGSLRSLDAIGAWFGRIVVNTCRDELRRRSHRPSLADLSLADAIADSATTPDSSVRDEVARALGRLSLDAQVVLALRYGADLTVPAIAERLGIPEGTAKTRLRDALEAARRSITSERAKAARTEEARA